MESTFLLLDESMKSWGIYTNKAILYNMYYNLKKLDSEKQFCLHEYYTNSNCIKNTIEDDDIEEFLQGAKQLHSKKEKLEAIPKEIKREIEKVKEKLSIFKDNFITFKRLLKDRVISLNETDINKIPELFKDKFEIFRDIIVKKVPPDDMFGYFADRFVPQLGTLSVETINDLTDVNTDDLDVPKLIANADCDETDSDDSDKESDSDSESGSDSDE